jgi:ElaA protein
MGASDSEIQFTSVEFADLSPSLLHEILRRRAEVFVVEQHCFYLDPDDHDAESRHVIGWLNGRVVAGARHFPYGNARKIGRVLTTLEIRGTGAGRALMRAVLEDIGPRETVLEAQAHLEHFYASLGWKKEGAVYDLDGIPHVFMRRAANT